MHVNSNLYIVAENFGVKLASNQNVCENFQRKISKAHIFFDQLKEHDSSEVTALEVLFSIKENGSLSCIAKVEFVIVLQGNST